MPLRWVLLCVLFDDSVIWSLAAERSMALVVWFGLELDGLALECVTVDLAIGIDLCRPDKIYNSL